MVAEALGVGGGEAEKEADGTDGVLNASNCLLISYLLFASSMAWLSATQGHD